MTDREPLKEMFNAAAVNWMAGILSPILTGFDAKIWADRVSAGLAPLELTERVTHIAACLADVLPSDYPTALHNIETALGPPAAGGTADSGSFRVLPLLRHVSGHGLAYPELAVPALGRLTRHFSAEFDIRPFLAQHTTLTLEYMQRWTGDPDPRIRRLASEGSRPRLPWGMRLQAFVADPSPTLPILTALRDDPDPVIRRSVANHLNDIAKDHPQRVVALAKDWMDDATTERRALLRHALRTLVKQGDQGALAVLGFDTHAPVTLAAFALDRDTVQFGGGLRLAGTLIALEDAKLSIDYAIHHRKADGSLVPKIFKLTTKAVKAGERITLDKAHAIRPITTRRYYPGLHRVELLVNGHSVGSADFVLQMGGV